MPARMEPGSRFGVELKSGSGPVVKESDKLDRAKASVYAWDDEKLQKTAVVQKRITKAATTVQRFIRACISHWKYYNEERIPLLQDLEDIKRRRLEELEEVKAFQKRGYEQAKFELEAEMAMPQEEYVKIQTLSNNLKREIKDEEEAAQQLEKDVLEENQHTQKLRREKHELEAQHTLSRLDVEIPALEAEKLDLEGADEEFGEVVAALQAQLDDMNLQIGLEEKHKKRLMKTLAKMLKELEARGAKPKLIQSVKLSIMYKGEDPPPKPPPAPAPEPPKEPDPEPAPAPEPPKALEPEVLEPEAAPAPEIWKATEVQQESPPPDESKSMAASSDEDDSDSSLDESTSSSSSSSEEEQQQQQQPEPSPRSAKKTRELRPPPGRSSTGQAPSHYQRTSTGTAIGKHSSRSAKKNKSSDGSRGESDFNWGDKEMVRRASLTSSTTQPLQRNSSRSMSPSRAPRKPLKKKDSKKQQSEDSEKRERAGRSRRQPRRSKSAEYSDVLAFKARPKKKNLPGASFDWSAMSGGEGPSIKKKEKKDKEKKSKKDKSDKKDKSEKKEKKKKSSSGKKSHGTMDSADGHFSWAFHGK